MVERDIIVAKCAIVDRCLMRIEKTRTQAKLSVTDTEDILVVNLQRAVQATIDIANHIVSSEGYGLADRLSASFSLLEREQVIEPELALKLRNMVGFRNIAVHDYQSIDMNIVESILDKHLDDLKLFCSLMLSKYAP